jgi:hypothetical protein
MVMVELAHSGSFLKKQFNLWRITSMSSLGSWSLYKRKKLRKKNRLNDRGTKDQEQPIVDQE